MDRLLYAKYFIFIGIFVLLQHQNCNAYEVKTFAQTVALLVRCAARMDIPNELTKKYRELSFPEDNLTKCFLKCSTLNMKLFDKNEGYNVESVTQQFRSYPLVEFLERDKTIPHLTEAQQQKAADEWSALHVEPIIEKCNKLHRNKNDACSWAYYGFTCIYKTIKDYILSKVLQQ